MNNDLNYAQIPQSYLLCIDGQCPKSATCLHYIAARYIPCTQISWSILSPAYIAALQGPCPYYSINRKVRYARGFLGILQQLTKEQTRQFSAQVIAASSRRTYYRIRCGERAICPQEQESLREVLRQCGVTDEPEFDSYFEDYQW
ncbi:DUF6078 family protein [Bacteroides fluxus]|jgi:hypothetical protein|uniref:DUF6078 family protein n=1 Tax=Bacteroides fluxus TaxID=626930 RepID=UPI0023F20D56|nr:DUF6078 family protein [Bacteroides fluxus]MDY3788581.1 DUF6078 family protein [Bacteroides fluxus]